MQLTLLKRCVEYMGAREFYGVAVVSENFIANPFKAFRKKVIESPMSIKFNIGG